MRRIGLAQRRGGVELRAGLPRRERSVDLGDDEAEVGVDPLDREGRLHEPAPPLVVVAVGHHERGGPVDRDQRLHGLAPLEAVGRLGDDVLVGLGAEHQHHPVRPVAEVDHRSVAPCSSCITPTKSPEASRGSSRR